MISKDRIDKIADSLAEILVKIADINKELSELRTCDMVMSRKEIEQLASVEKDTKIKAAFRKVIFDE